MFAEHDTIHSGWLQDHPVVRKERQTFMDIRYATHPDEMPRLTPAELRDRFVVAGLFAPGHVRMAMSFHDRLVIGGAMPAGQTLQLPAPDELRCEHFCDRREVAIVCLEGTGNVNVDGADHPMNAEDILYVGKGTQSADFGGNATFYFVSAPAHQELPTRCGTRAAAETHEIGDPALASARTLRKYVHEDGIASCELAVGITTLAEGSVWNTMPCHTHERRTEIYLYFGLPEDARVIHLCGRPDATRSLILANREAVISPPWSIHTGAGTAPYRFVWSTGGENLAYNDMDVVATESLR
jgi:4-deoxy-L-threo-5-hexosulose-uronate ketol-isomerase